MKRMLSATALLCIATLLCTLPAFAQNSQTGAIVGRAQDATGAVIPGVEVTITSPSMIGGAKTVVTDEQGVYRFELLSPGTYKVSFALPGFKTLNYTDITVQPNITQSQNGTMEVSSTAEEVTVTSQAPAIDLQAATVGVNWSQKMIDDLPWSRSLIGISQMIPNTYATSYDIGNSNFGTSSVISANLGGRSGGTVVMLDGLYWCQTYSDYGTFEEMAVSTMAKGAEQMNSGITINMVVKTGSNQYHGNVSMDYQNGSMESHNISAAELAQGFPVGSTQFTHLTDYFGDIGGPILKDKLWFYVSGRQAYQGSFIPGFLNAVGGSQAVFDTVLRGPSAKLSYQLTSKQKIDAYWGLPDKHQPYRGANALQPQDATQNQDSWSAQGPIFTWTDILDSKTTLQAKLSRGGYWWPAYAYSLPSGLGPTIFANGGFERLPTFNVFGVDNVGAHISDTTSKAVDGSYDTNYTRPIRWQWNFDASRVMTIGGKANQVKVGYMGWWDKSYTIDFRYPNQEAYVYKSTSADPICPQSIICNNYFLHPYEFTADDGPYSTNQGGKYEAFYVNDQITMSRKLTVNVGLRYDWATSFLDPQGNDGNGPFAIKYEIPYNGENNSGGIYNFPTYPMLSPRVSLAYDVTGNGRFALKGSYGRYYGITSSPNSQPGPGANTSNVDPITLKQCTYNNWDGSIPVSTALLQKDFGPDGVMGTADDVGLTAACPGAGTNGTHTFASNLNPSYLDEYAGGFEWGINKDYSFRANFVRKFDYNNAASTSTNNIGSGGTTGAVATNPLLPYSAYSAMTCATDPGTVKGQSVNSVGQVCIYAVPNTGNSVGQAANPNFATTDVNYVAYAPHEGEGMYTSYDFTLNKAYSHNYSFLVGFNTDLGRQGVANPLTPNQALYNSQLDLPQWNRAFKLNWVYGVPAVPLFVAHYRLPGLQWSSTFTSQSGQWYSRSVNVVDANGATDAVVVNGHYGRYPAVSDWDQRVTKRFRIKDRDTIELRWDLYNTLNRDPVTGYRSLNSSSTSTFFQTDGQPLIPSAILPARIMEYGASFKF